MNSLVVRTSENDIQIKGNEFEVLTTDFDKTVEMLESRLKLILTSYLIRQGLGLPWLDYLHNVNIDIRHEYIKAYMYNEVLKTPNINVESVVIEHVGTHNRTASFDISCTYGTSNETINIIL